MMQHMFLCFSFLQSQYHIFFICLLCVQVLVNNDGQMTNMYHLFIKLKRTFFKQLVKNTFLIYVDTRNQTLRVRIQNSRCLFLVTSKVAGMYFSYLRSQFKSVYIATFDLVWCTYKSVCLIQQEEQQQQQQQQLHRVLYSDLGGCCIFLP